MARRKRIQRKALSILPEAEVVKLQPVIDWSIKTENVEPVCCYVFSYFDNGKKLLGELKTYVDGYSKSNRQVQAIKEYLVHVAGIDGLLDGKSLASFSKYLTNTKKNANTAYFIFIHARAFVKHLISAKVLAKQKLPKAPERVENKSKESFFEKVYGDLERLEVLNKYSTEIKQCQLKYGLDKPSARALYFMDHCMTQIHKKALGELRKALDEMSYVDDVIESMTQEEVAQYKAVESFSEFPTRLKSRELCVKILYSHFGRMLPPSARWPKGMPDWLKRHWQIRRITSAFFPDTICHQHLFSAILSHKEIWANVDSVFYYAYMDCILPAFESGKVDILFRKHRGEGVSETLSIKDPLVVLLSKYLELFKKRLSESEEGRKVLAQEHVPIMTHALTMRGNRSYTTYDASSSSDMMRACIAEYAQDCDLLSILKESGVTGENFRPTHSVMAKLKGVKQSSIKTKLSHSESQTTESYTDRVETSTLVKAKQKGFQEYIIEQAKISAKDMQQPLDELVDMPQIENSKRVIFSDVNQFAEWIALRDKIYNEKDRLSVSNPARWVKHWMVKLAELDGLLSLVGTTEYSEAKALAKSVDLPYLD